MQISNYTTTLLIALLTSSLYGCKQKTQPKPPTPQRSKAPPVRQKVTPPPHKLFSTPADAMREILKQKFRVIGVGEFHQTHKVAHIPSSIEHFTRELLPLLQKRTTDLLLETWVTTGNCGKTAKKVVKQVKQVIQRPKKTTNHILNLLRKAKRLKIQPHILNVHCKMYPSLMGKQKRLDPIKTLRFVTERLHHKASFILKRRKAMKQDATIVIYSGALHNDTNPSKILRPYSYVPKLSSSIPKQQYLEVDLYVPEYIQHDPDYRKETWFPLLRKTRSNHKTLLIQTTPRSFILLLPWSKHNTKSPPPPTKR